MTTTNVAVASVTIAPSSDVGPIATHSKVTVTTSAVHGLTDDQNQIVLTGSDNPTHINGIHNVHSVSNTTVFTYEIIKSTVPAGEACEGTFKLQTYDGIDKTGAVIKDFELVVLELVLQRLYTEDAEEITQFFLGETQVQIYL